MSATIWKTRGFVCPYAPRRWKIPHAGLCDQVFAAGVEPETGAEDGWLRVVEPENGGHIIGSFDGRLA